MEVLVLDGKNYIKASKAARDLGYASDYVSQLCRSKQVDAHLIGRTWYVDQEQLSTHRTEKKRMSRLKAREHAKKTIEEHRVKIHESKNNYKDIDIRYEQDNNELIPKTRKLVIEIEKEKKNIFGSTPDVSEEADILNEGNKVILSGDVAVVDVTDELADPDTVFLTPSKIIKSHPQVKESRKEERVLDVIVDETDMKGAIDTSRNPKQREEIIKDEENTQLHNNLYRDSDIDTSTEGTPIREKASFLPYGMVIFFLCFSVLSTIPLSFTILYTENNAPQTVQGVTFSIERSIEIIKEKYSNLGKTI